MKSYEERMKHDREELQGDNRERVERIQKEKDTLETKYDKKRRDFKNLEQTSTKERNETEREHAVTIEKIKNEIFKFSYFTNTNIV